MTYTITQNPAHNSLEITFDGKPAQAVREALKALRFRWHGVKKLWYGYADETEARAAIDAAAAGHAEQAAAQPAGENSGEEKKPLPVRDPALLEKFRREMTQFWKNDEKMVRYHLDQVAELVELSNGLFISIEKQRIETRFCFGESGYDAEDAAHEAHVARTDEQYFINENMREYRRTLEILNTGERGYTRVLPCLVNYYTTQDKNSMYRGLKFLSIGDVLEALGGSGDLEAIKGTEIPGQRFTSSGTPVYVCTDEDVERLRAGYERAMNAHERKVRAYLKRYGLSKVRSWTYWRDA